MITPGRRKLTDHGDDPFPYWVVDDFIDDASAEQALDEYPDLTEVHRVHCSNGTHSRLKYAINHPPTPFFQELYYFFQSEQTTEYLKFHTGFEDLHPDPTNQGAGLHEIVKGGFLRIHADFSHSKMKKKRVLNILYFLNKDWEDSWNGNLELWDKEMKRCKISINPSFNRVIFFKTSETSYHGHPDPLDPPEGRTRKALAFYYYGDESQVDYGGRRHGTLYQTRPGYDDLDGREELHI